MRSVAPERYLSRLDLDQEIKHGLVFGRCQNRLPSSENGS